MNKRFYLKCANLLCCLFIAGQIVYGQNTLSQSFHDKTEADSKAVKKSAIPPDAKNNSLSGEPLSDKLQAVLLRVKSSTEIPVLVPDAMPQAENKRNVCVTGGSNRDAYIITISEESGCGANAGMIASFTAERNARLSEKSEADKVISLANGIVGFYTAKSCGASCAPPQIEFVYENVLYTFQFKPSEKGVEFDETSMIELVNSAITQQKVAKK